MIIESNDPELAVDAHHLRRTFRPARTFFRAGPELVAVEDVSLQIERGTIYGLLGHNGAGKTTTIKMLSTLLIPTSGEAHVAGFDVATQERAVRRRLGVVLGGDRGLYGKLTAWDNLTYFGYLYGMDPEEIPKRAEELLDLVGLADRAKHRVEGFSRGMKQRLHLAKALMHRPPVLFLDEPSIGLDPAAAVKLRELIQELVPQHTVLLTTHYLHEADQLCDRIAIIDQGRIIVEDTPAGIKRRVGGDVRHEIRTCSALQGDAVELLRRLPSISAVEIRSNDGYDIVQLVAPEESTALDDSLRLIHRAGLRVLGVATHDLTLEDAFLSLTNGGGDAG